MPLSLDRSRNHNHTPKRETIAEGSAEVLFLFPAEFDKLQQQYERSCMCHTWASKVGKMNAASTISSTN
eukprot:2837554-Amphidinium_carterae.1